MPKLSEEVVDTIIEVLKQGTYKNCTEISDYINKKYNLNTGRRIIGDINKGLSHHRESEKYPISLKYARGFLTTCCICGEKSEAMVDGKEYCHKHYMQMYHHNEILKETIFDKNEIEDHGDYIEILLKNQFFEIVAKTKIDKEDYERVKQYKWYCYNTDGGKQYCEGTLEHGLKVRLHHFILNSYNLAKENKVVDHINGDSLDNRKANLRIVSQKENMQNLKANNPMTGIRVHYLKDGTPRYGARITFNYQTISLGTFDTLSEAQEARKKAKEKYKMN